MITISSTDVIKQTETFKIPRFSISNLISSQYYVEMNIKIEMLADALANNENIFVIGVVDNAKRIQGIIIKKDLFTILGKRFGRELYYNKTAGDVMIPVKQFNYFMHIFECAKMIEQHLINSTQEYYGVIDEYGIFKGIFSTRDMLMFLSKLTQKDIEQSKRVLNRLVKKEYEVYTKRLHIGVRNEMVQDIGGDSYYIIHSTECNKVIVGVCDVSGKGISASMFTTLISGMIATYDFNNNIERFFIQLNNYIYTTFEGERFVTCCFAVFDEDNALVHIYDFGHSLVYLFRDNNLYKLLTKENSFPLGIEKIKSVKCGKISLKTLDNLLIFTDGCIEQRNANNEEYGSTRLQKQFIVNYSDNIMKTLDHIINDINDFRNTIPQHDDITIACIRYD